MSPRAAWRLESWGFERSFDYVAGKMDWISFGLPYEGQAHLVASELRPDAPTCALGDPVAGIGPSPFGFVVVLNDADVVMGVVSDGDLGSDATAEDVMQEGVTTVRPSEDVHDLSERMERAGRDAIVVTSSDGRFLGVFRGHDGDD